MNEILKEIDDHNVIDQIKKVIPFHGYLSTGAFIGIQMLNLATSLLDIKEGEKIYVTCETQNCIPDPFQILCGCTVGNKSLKIIEHGKMAVTVNKAGIPGETVKGIRIIVDPEKTIKYPIFLDWFMNEAKVSHQDAIKELIIADGDVYGWYFVDLPVPIRTKKKIAICSACGESFVREKNELICKWCSNPENL